MNFFFLLIIIIIIIIVIVVLVVVIIVITIIIIIIIIIIIMTTKRSKLDDDSLQSRRKEMSYITKHSIHFIYGYTASIRPPYEIDPTSIASCVSNWIYIIDSHDLICPKVI